MPISQKHGRIMANRFAFASFDVSHRGRSGLDIAHNSPAALSLQPLGVAPPLRDTTFGDIVPVLHWLFSQAASTASQSHLNKELRLLLYIADWLCNP